MGFFGSIASVVVKTVITPVAIVKDVVNIATDKDATTTKKHINSITNDVDEALDDLFE